MAVTLLVLPAIANAQTTFGTTGRWIDRIGDLVAKIIPITIALALVVFFWGLIKFISKAGDEAEVKKGKGIMTWGIIALFVMITIWGIISFIGKELNISRLDQFPSVIPKVPRP